MARPHRCPASASARAAAPYTPIAIGDKQLTNRGTSIIISAKAGAAWPRGKAHVAMQLAADKQVIDLGPVFVLDLGPDYDINTLPHD